MKKRSTKHTQRRQRVYRNCAAEERDNSQELAEKTKIGRRKKVFERTHNTPPISDGRAVAKPRLPRLHAPRHASVNSEVQCRLRLLISRRRVQKSRTTSQCWGYKKFENKPEISPIHSAARRSMTGYLVHTHKSCRIAQYLGDTT